MKNSITILTHAQWCAKKGIDRSSRLKALLSVVIETQVGTQRTDQENLRERMDLKEILRKYVECGEMTFLIQKPLQDEFISTGLENVLYKDIEFLPTQCFWIQAPDSEMLLPRRMSFRSSSVQTQQQFLLDHGLRLQGAYWYREGTRILLAPWYRRGTHYDENIVMVFPIEVEKISGDLESWITHYLQDDTGVIDAALRPVLRFVVNTILCVQSYPEEVVESEGSRQNKKDLLEAVARKIPEYRLSVLDRTLVRTVRPDFEGDSTVRQGVAEHMVKGHRHRYWVGSGPEKRLEYRNVESYKRGSIPPMIPHIYVPV